MPQQIEPTASIKAERIAALALETGATEAQIKSIVELIGFDRASIIREARLLTRRRPQK